MDIPAPKASMTVPAAPANEDTRYYVCDHLGTARVVMNEAGTVVERHDFTPFGVEIPPSTNVAENTHQYTGQERDATTQMDYVRFRYYGSTMGRFMKPDNVVGNAADPQSWNLYAYVRGNPISFNDPTGHIADDPLRDNIADEPESKKDDIPSDRSDSDSLNKPNKEQTKKGADEGSQKQPVVIVGGKSAKTVAPLKGTKQGSGSSKARKVVGKVMVVAGKILKVKGAVDKGVSVMLGGASIFLGGLALKDAEPATKDALGATSFGLGLGSYMKLGVGAAEGKVGSYLETEGQRLSE